MLPRPAFWFADEVRLCKTKLIQKTIFERVDFIESETTPEIPATSADITRFDNRVLEYLSLYAEVPRVDQTGLEIRIETADRITGLDRDWKGRCISEAWWSQCCVDRGTEFRSADCRHQRRWLVSACRRDSQKRSV